MDQGPLKEIQGFFQMDSHQCVQYRTDAPPKEIWLLCQVRDHPVIFTVLGVCMELINLSFCTWSGTQASATINKDITVSCLTGMNRSRDGKE